MRATLIEMTHLMTDNLMRECNGDVTNLVETPVLVHVTIKSASLRLDWDTKENYMIDVQNKGTLLKQKEIDSRDSFDARTRES